MGDQKKTLTNLSRLLEEGAHPKNAADFFRESTWQAQAISDARKRFMLTVLLTAVRLFPATASATRGTSCITDPRMP